MSKALTFFLTIIIGALPALLNGFNIPLSFSPLSPGPGKVIKPASFDEGDFRIKTIVIDPGHGGHDPGCLGSDSHEKDIALAISQKLASLVRNRFPDLRVVMTRSEDVFIPLYERAAIANRNDADLFISIHCNFMPGSRATNGTETYVMGLHTAAHNLDVAKRENASILLEDNYQKNYDYDPNSPEGHIMLSMFQNAYLEQSIRLAEKVEAYIGSEASRRSRGVKQAGFVVLKETAMPSILIETGFLSNAKEEDFLNTDEGQTLIAGAILNAFSDYKDEVEGTTGPLARLENRSPAPTAPPDSPAAKAVPVAAKASPPPSTPATKSVRQAETPPPTKGLPDKAAAASPQSPPASPPVTVQKEPMIIPYTYQDGTEVTPNGAWSPPPSPPLPASAPQRQAVPKATEVPDAGIRFCVQLAAAPKPVDTQSLPWRQIEYLIEVVQEDNLFKYQARNFDNLQQAFEARLKLQHQGFPDAFIVAYKNGYRISVEQAKRELGIW